MYVGVNIADIFRLVTGRHAGFIIQVNVVFSLYGMKGLKFLLCYKIRVNFPVVLYISKVNIVPILYTGV